MRLGTRLALLVVGGCGMPSIENEVVFEGRHIELHADPSLPVCRSSVDTEDLYLEAVAALLDVPVPDVHYYLYSDDVSVCNVDKYAADCTSGTDVYATMWPHEHELVHAVAATLGRAPAFLAEGLAQGLASSDMLRPDQRLHSVPVLDSIAFFAGDAPQNYLIAADFTRYLIKRLGVAPFVKLYRATLFLDDPITIRAAFEREMGVSFDAVVADWQNAPGVSQSAAFPTALSRCLLPAMLPTSPNVWSGTENIDCLTDLDPRAVLLQKSGHTFDVDAPSMVSMRVGSPGTNALVAWLKDCGQGDRQIGQTLYDVGDDLIMASVAPGRHALELYQSGDAVMDRTVEWTITNHGPAGATCATATPVTVPETMSFSAAVNDPPGRWNLVPDPVNGDRYELWLRYDGITQPELSAHISGSDLTITGEACTGSCDALDCVSARYMDHWMIAPNSTVYVHISAPASAANAYFWFILRG